MAEREDREMTLKLSKVRGHADQYTFIYDNGSKVVSWQVDGNNVDTEILTDVVDTVHPALTPTLPRYPLDLTPEQWSIVKPVIPGLENYGAEAADKAAHDEEMRLRNMGGALRTGINLAAEDIPVFDDGGLPEVNWGV